MYYYLQVTNKGVFAYVESIYYELNPPQAYYSRFVYPHDNDTNEGKGYIRFLNGSLSLYIHSSEPSDPDDVIAIPRASSAQYMKLMPDGHLQVFERQLEHWVVVADLLTDKNAGLCDNYPLSCGRNSVCLNNLQCSCPAVEYFRPVNDRQPNLGCSEITPLSCSSKHDQDFITLENVKYLSPTSNLQGVSEEACKQAWLKDCTCKAAFFQYDSNASIGKCFITSDIFTMNTNDSLDYSSLALIKVQNDRSSHQVATIVGSTIGIHKQKRDAEMEEEYLDQVPGMATRFSYEELKTATGNFGKMLGEGGFGSVFEGSLQDGSKIAVKCLEGLLHIKKIIPG
ncbi:putative non-specific serine/threonine protein kinase [Helianthus debilis subsp. tardiflorus]